MLLGCQVQVAVITEGAESQTELFGGVVIARAGKGLF